MGDVTPSFFELVAAEQLEASLYPALRFALELLARRHRIFAVLATRTSEVHALVSLFLETASLRRDAATLSEGFYSLRRAEVGRDAAGGAAGGGGVLPPGAVATALMWRVVVPYTRRSMDALYRSSLNADMQQRQRRRPMVVRRWRALTGCADALGVCFKLAYLLGGTRHFTPALWAQGVVLRRATPADVARPYAGRVARGTGARVMRAFDGLSNVLKYGCFAALVCFRFLEHVQAASSEAGVGVGAPPTPAPPRPPPVGEGSECRQPPDDDEMCAICERPRTTPAALLVSGYVFCYACVLDHVRAHQRCPITGAPASRADICRVYHG